MKRDSYTDGRLQKFKMNIINLTLLFVIICCLDFSVAKGKKTTTRSPNACTKGSIITFPTYLSRTNDVSSSDPLFSKKCRKIKYNFGLWVYCISGPNYECQKPTTAPISTTTPTTNVTTLPAMATTTTTQSGSNVGCNASQTSPTTTGTPTAAGTPTATGTPTAAGTPTATGTTATETPTATGTTATETPTATGTTATETPTATGTTATEIAITIETTKAADAPSCSYNEASFGVGAQELNQTGCYYMNCQSDGTWAPAPITIPTTGQCSPPFKSYRPYGCFMFLAKGTDFCTTRLECQQKGGDLWTSAYLDSMPNFYNISATLFPKVATDNSWIGMYGYGPDLYWLNGQVATNQFKAMNGDNFDETDNTGKCVNAFYTDITYYGWELIDCTSLNNVSICERLP